MSAVINTGLEQCTFMGLPVTDCQLIPHIDRTKHTHTYDKSQAESEVTKARQAQVDKIQHSVQQG